MNTIAKNKLNTTKISSNLKKSDDNSNKLSSDKNYTFKSPNTVKSKEHQKVENNDVNLNNTSIEESQKQLQQRRFLYRAPSHLYDF